MTQALGTPDQPLATASYPGPLHAFKEWALVCDSMLRGQTSLIFRKGGIAEGREGFRFQYERFFLFPTFFHEQVERLRIDPATTIEPKPDTVTISGLVQIEFTHWVDDLRLLEPLADLHVLKPEVLAQRFAYDDPKGLHLAMIRVFRVTPAWTIPFQKSFGGCRSWVELPESPAQFVFTPVLEDSEHAVRRDRVKTLHLD